MADYWSSLDGENYINLETFKKSGVGVKTPVWFARDGDALVFFTRAEAWKVKRLRRNPQAKAAACGVRGKIRGEWLDVTCVRLEGDAEDRANKLLAKKYLMMRLSNPLANMTGYGKGRAYFKVEPRRG